MKKLIEFIKNRWVVSLIGLLALGILIWFVGPLVAIAGSVPLAGEVARLVAILVIAVLWGLNNLRIQMQVNKMNEQMVSGMAEPVIDSGAGAIGEQSSEEVATLKDRFDEALGVLRKTARKNGGAGIYDLPWYIIIGPPGCGKTTALVNSGLNFPLAERFGKEALRGVGGTRNCDWWFTDEAVLIDTAGRYVTQDSQAEVDSAAWEGFLGLLKKHRRRRPINGALVAVSLSDLLLLNEEERARHVNAIRQRLQELNKNLGIRFPVYVLLTKCDLIAGFMEFFDDLGKEERDQVWGVTFPMEDASNPGASIQRLTAEFDLLVERINQRMLWRMNQERDPQRRARIFGFPLQLASIREVGSQFLTDIFRPSRFDEELLLRGVYFTSGTQEGAPIDRIMGSLARTFGIASQGLAPSRGQGRSYFLTRMLRDVIFQEADLAGSNRRLETKRAWLQKAAYGGAVAITVLAVMAWTTSFTRNQVHVSRFKDRVEKYNEISKQDIVNGGDFDQLLPRLNAIREVTGVYDSFKDGTPWLMGMGLYQGTSLTEAGNDAYQRELQNVFVPAIRSRLEHHLEAGVGDPDFQYEVLKTYLMLGDRQHLDPELLGLWMRLDWRNTYPAEAGKQGELQSHLAAMLELGYEPVRLDNEVIESARLSLNQVPLAQLIYGRMKRDYLVTDKQPFRISDALGIDGSKVFERNSGVSLDSGIPGLFTYKGYHDLFRKEIENIARQSSEENWVLDPGKKSLSAPEIEQLQTDLQQLYFTDYVRTWRQTLDDVVVTRFSNLRHATEVLEVLSGRGSPMRRLLLAVEKNTNLDTAGGLLATMEDQAGQALSSKSRLARLMQSVSDDELTPKTDQPEAIVGRQFEAVNALVRAPDGGTAPIEQLIDLLSQLYGQFDSMSVGMGSDALAMAQGTGNDTIRRIQVEAARQPEPVKHWLQQIASNSRTVTMGGARDQINQEWQATVAPVCNRAFSGRYPFDSDSSQEMTLADFGRLFGPGGLIDGFFNNNLRKFVNVSGEAWRWKSVGDANLGISNAALQQFRRADSIKQSFFQGGDKLPSVSFGLKPVYLDANVQSFLLDLEGQKLQYRHGPARVTRVQWPYPDSTGQVRIVFEDASGKRLTRSKDGPWAWFRLLDQATMETISSDKLLATFDVSGRKVTWEIQASSVVNPFVIKQLQQFRCPNSL